MQKVLITGANGFVSYYLVKLLIENGYMVIATGKGNCRWTYNNPNLIYESMDITDGEIVKNIFEKHQPDIVVHCGAISKPDECELNKEAAYRTNVSGTVNLLDQAGKLKSFFIFLSTDFVFDGKKGMYEEDDDTDPVNYYGITKVLAETEVKQYAFPWAIVRTVLVYGKTFSERQNIVTNTAAALKRNERLKIFSDQVRTPTYVDDLAKGIKTIIDKKATGIFHLSGADVLSPYEIAVHVAAYLNIDSTMITKVTEDEFDQPARRPAKTGFNLSKARKELGYECISFAEGLRRTLE